jgi:hypothetical protein
MVFLHVCSARAFPRQSAEGRTRRFGPQPVTSGLLQIVLQKSKVASARIFGETLKRETIDGLDNLSRAIEAADEFSVKR